MHLVIAMKKKLSFLTFKFKFSDLKFKLSSNSVCNNEVAIVFSKLKV